MTTDVNVAFAAERAGQIAQAYAARDRAEAYNERSLERYARDVAAFDQRLADGKLKDLGNGRFQVTEPGSWDNGEVLYLSQPTPQSARLILPEVGLDTLEDGRSALYTMVPSWHSTEGAGLIPEGTKDVDKVLELGGINWTTEQALVRYMLPQPPEVTVEDDLDFGPMRSLREQIERLRSAPEHFVNYRSDTGDPLGVVGSKYTPVQNRTAFTFLQELVGHDDVIFESAGSIRGGRKVFVCVRLPEDVIIDAEGINDVIRPIVAVINTHDGSGMFRAIVTPWRIECGNTERFAVRDAHTSWGVQHTASAPDRIQEAQRQLGLTVTYFDRFAEEENQLARTDITIDQVQSLISGLWVPEGDKEQSKRGDTLFAKRTDTLNVMYERQAQKTGPNAYSMERTITDYLDNVAPKRAVGGSMAAARATAVLEGTDDKVKTRAHQKLLRLVA